MAWMWGRSLHKDFGIKPILRDGRFTLAAGDKVGLIGTNGSGKSTLLRMVAGLEPFDRGEFWVDSGARVVYLAQDPPLDDRRTVLAQARALVDAQRPPEADWEIETRAKTFLDRLGVRDLDAPVGTLSGGYRKRIALAAALTANPDVLLLDEPTNHLDTATVEWLQEFLQQFRGALWLVTHDRYFLDRVTTRILELDRGALIPYEGNYAYYLEQKAQAEERDRRTQQKHRGVLRRELEWLRRGPKARSTKQKARIERVRTLQNREFQTAQGQVELALAGRRIGKTAIELHHVHKRFGDRPILRDFSAIVPPEGRIGITGPNGVGKSTLVNLMAGRETPDAGEIVVGSTVVFGYFDQHSELLTGHENTRVLDYLKNIAEWVTTNQGETLTASQLLERFLFPPDSQYAPIHKLSGGEKRRLFLLQVLIGAPNVLILDEPTNDLDIQTLGVLEDYLEDFPGCVLVVSHDRYFLDRTVDEIWALPGDGTVTRYTGNYSEYLEWTRAPAPPKESPTTTAVPRPKDRAPSRTKLSYKEKRERDSLEQEIPQLEAQKAALEAQLYGQPPTDYSALQALTAQLAALAQRIDEATERWLTLAEREP